MDSNSAVPSDDDSRLAQTEMMLKRVLELENAVINTAAAVQKIEDKMDNGLYDVIKESRARIDALEKRIEKSGDAVRSVIMFVIRALAVAFVAGSLGLLGLGARAWMDAGP